MSQMSCLGKQRELFQRELSLHILFIYLFQRFCLFAANKELKPTFSVKACPLFSSCIILVEGIYVFE